MKIINTLLLVILLAPAAAHAQQAPDNTSKALFRIGPGDLLEIRVLNRPQLSRDAVRVDNDGLIRVPMVDEAIRASCRTEAELADDISQRYLKYLRHPQVSIFIKEYSSNPVAVIGAVDKPGQFQLNRRVRLLELISLSGGPTDRAGKRVLVAHSAGTSECEPAAENLKTQFESFNLDDTLKAVDEANPYARPGDVITIPEAQQAFVIGNVPKPGSVSLKEKMTVLQAVAMAGGTLPDTRKDQVRLLRESPNGGAKTAILVNLNAISKHQADDIELRPNDIIEVPVSSGKRFLRGLGSSIFPSALRIVP